MFRDRAHRLHFVGIGGIGMSGIAEVLLNLGYDVRGSDLRESEVTQRLSGFGATIFMGHHRSNIGDADVVVVSTAIQKDCPELVEARRLGIPVIRRAEMLAELMRMKYGIAIAGTHGKTTTTSLVGTILSEGDMDPTIVVGGRVKSLLSNARLGAGDYLVAEADESDGSFLNLMPTIAVVTNIDAEHLDHWSGGLDEIVDAFVDFVNKVPFYGCAILCLDHPTVQASLPRIEKRYMTYGISSQADYSAHDLEAGDGAVSFMVRRHGEELGRIQLNMVGRHNVENALAAIAVADEVGVPFEVTAEALKQFEGVGRRFEVKGCVNDVMVVDDYGHHPAEIRATLEAAREAYSRRIVVVFQPHRYTRTRDFMNEFATAFNASDVVLVSDIYAASEQPIEGISAESLTENIALYGHGDVTSCGSLDTTLQGLLKAVQSGDLVITLGAGSIYSVGERLLERLGEG